MASGPPLVVPQATQVRLLGTNLGSAQINVLHAVNPGGVVINQALADTLATAIRSAWTTNIAPHVTTSCHLATIGLRDLRFPHMAEYLGTGAAADGILTTDALPGATAICVSLKTAKAGASFRGRVYLGGWSEAENTAGGAIVAAANTAAVAFVTAVQASLSTSGLQLAVLSRPAFSVTTTVETRNSDGSTSVETHTTAARAGEINAVTSIVARNAIWDSQNRRKSPGSGSSLFQVPVAQSFVD